MDAVLRAAAIYLFLLVLFRIAGKRSLAQITTFDLVLVLIIAEAVQQGMLGEDFSLTNSFLIVVALVGIDIGLSFVKEYVPALGRVIDSTPLVLIEDGELHGDRMAKSRVDETDILTAAREKQGLERLEQIKYAVLEQSGGISIVPKEELR